MTDKEAIGFINNRLEIIEKTRKFNFKTDLEIAIETLLNLIQTQQEEIEKKDKIIDKMAEFIFRTDTEMICNFFKLSTCEEMGCIECIKKYFEESVENVN